MGGLQHSVYARELPPTTLDEPPEVAGGDKGISPHETIMGAVGACVATGFVVQATAQSERVDFGLVAGLRQGKLESAERLSIGGTELTQAPPAARGWGPNDICTPMN